MCSYASASGDRRLWVILWGAVVILILGWRGGLAAAGLYLLSWACCQPAGRGKYPRAGGRHAEELSPQQGETSANHVAAAVHVEAVAQADSRLSAVNRVLARNVQLL